jgi:hypothetical protein
MGVAVCYSKGRIFTVLLFLDYMYPQDGSWKFLHNTGNYLPVDIPEDKSSSLGQHHKYCFSVYCCTVALLEVLAGWTRQFMIFKAVTKEMC